jgi:hypothetical protein
VVHVANSRIHRDVVMVFSLVLSPPSLVVWMALVGSDNHGPAT